MVEVDQVVRIDHDLELVASSESPQNILWCYLCRPDMSRAVEGVASGEPNRRLPSDAPFSTGRLSR